MSPTFCFCNTVRASTTQTQVKSLRLNNFPNPSSLKEGKVARWYQEIPKTKCVKDVNEDIQGRLMGIADGMKMKGSVNRIEAKIHVDLQV